MFVCCLIGQVATMNREKGGRHYQFLDKWLKEFGWLQTRGSGDDLSMIEVSQSCSLHILLQSAMFCKYSLKIKGFTKIGCATPDTKNH